jgi:hypothetical protein
LADEAVQQATEDLEQSVAEKMAWLEAATKAETGSSAGKAPERNRGALPTHLPRVDVIVDVQGCPSHGEPSLTLCPNFRDHLKRSHSSLDARTPDQAYFNHLPLAAAA